MKTRKVSNLIIGSGFTGLLLASKLDSALVVSNEDVLGGLIKNTVVDGYSFDFGGHVYTTSDPNVSDLMSKIPSKLHKSRKAFFDFERNVPFPVQDNAHMLGLQVTPGSPDEHKPTNLYEYSSSILGKRFTDGFMMPFNNRVWSTKMNKMDFDWTYGRIKAPSEAKSNWGMNSSFYYARGEDIIKPLIENAKRFGAEFLKGEVAMVNVDKKVAVLESGELIGYDQLFMTSSHAVNALPTNNVLTIGIGLSHEIEDDFHWTYAKFGQEVHRVTLLSRYMDGLAPDKCDSLLLEIPFMFINELSFEAKMLTEFEGHDKEAFKLAKFILGKAGFRNHEKLSPKVVWTAITKGYPVPIVGHRGYVSSMKSALLGRDVILAGRWGAHGYYNLQHIFAEVDAICDVVRGGDISNYIHANFYYQEKR